MKGTLHALFRVATRHRMCYEIIDNHAHNSGDHTHNSWELVHNRGNHMRKNWRHCQLTSTSWQLTSTPILCVVDSGLTLCLLVHPHHLLLKGKLCPYLSKSCLVFLLQWLLMSYEKSSKDMSLSYATNGLPRNSLSSNLFPSNKFVNVWACTRYLKYPSGIMIFNVAHTGPYINNYIMYVLCTKLCTISFPQQLRSFFSIDLMHTVIREIFVVKITVLARFRLPSGAVVSAAQFLG